VIRLLIADDSALMRKLLGEIFSKQPDFTLEYARNGLETLERLKSYHPDVITLDIQMPHMDGLKCLERIMIEQPCPVVMVSSLTEKDAATTLEAIRMGAVDFIAKPGGAISLGLPDMADQLIAKVRQAASAKLRSTPLLKERVRHRMQNRRSETRPSSSRSKPPEARDPATGFGLVLVGTSTGGPPALEALLEPLPAGFSWPIVIAQHMPESFTGPLSQRLDRLCALTVKEVVRPTLLEPGHAYIGRGDADVIISSRSAGLVVMPAPADPEYPWHPSTDRLVRSAMTHLASSQLIGVLMTGMGNDGASAMAQMRAEGGQTIAESEETAVIWGMPGELVKAEGADWILPVGEIAPQLKRMVR
jgi:two-component system chemotaxis response regulator CheB